MTAGWGETRVNERREIQSQARLSAVLLFSSRTGKWGAPSACI